VIDEQVIAEVNVHSARKDLAALAVELVRRLRAHEVDAVDLSRLPPDHRMIVVVARRQQRSS
jgi:hypothetical protein